MLVRPGDPQILNPVKPGEPYLGKEYWFPESVPSTLNKSGPLSGLHSANTSSSIRKSNPKSLGARAKTFNKNIDILKNYENHRNSYEYRSIKKVHRECRKYINDNDVHDGEKLKIYYDFSKKYFSDSNKHARGIARNKRKNATYRKSNERNFSININMLKNSTSGKITQEQREAYERCELYIKMVGIEPTPDQKELYNNFSRLLGKKEMPSIDIAHTLNHLS